MGLVALRIDIGREAWIWVDEIRQRHLQLDRFVTQLLQYVGWNGQVVIVALPKFAPARELERLDLRLREDIGLDSLALSELAFKLDEVFAVPIETHEVAHVITVQDLQHFLRGKLSAPSSGDVRTVALPVIS